MAGAGFKHIILALAVWLNRGSLQSSVKLCSAIWSPNQLNVYLPVRGNRLSYGIAAAQWHPKNCVCVCLCPYSLSCHHNLKLLVVGDSPRASGHRMELIPSTTRSASRFTGLIRISTKNCRACDRNIPRHRSWWQTGR